MKLLLLVTALLGVTLSSSGVFAADKTQTCDADGVCTTNLAGTQTTSTPVSEGEEEKKAIGVSRYANSEGKPVEAVEDCFDRHESCEVFANQGECTKNPGWMIIHCSVSCDACHLRSSQARCGRENLNTTDTGFLVPGKLNQMFERVDKELRSKYKVNVLSYDPWVVTIDDFVTDAEADALISVVGDKWERSTDTGSMNKYGETGRKLSSR
jgi:hypothetical protein